MKKALFLILFSASTCHASPFTNFYVNHNGDGATNYNAGSSTGNPVFHFEGGNWSLSLTSFTVTGSSSLASVTAGMYASVYATGQSSTSFVGLISQVTTDSIIFYSSSASRGLNGSAPTATGGTNIVVGGVWMGPDATQGLPFPFNFISSQTTNGTLPIIVWGTGTSSTTVALTSGKPNITWKGYKKTPGDCDTSYNDPTCKWVLQDSTVAVVLLTGSGVTNNYFNIDFSTNGASGANAVVSVTGAGSVFRRSIFRGGRAAGIATSANAVFVDECECYDSNRSNTATTGCITTSNATTIKNTFIHHMPGTNSSGIRATASSITVYHNLITTCTIGIDLANTGATDLTLNTIYQSSVAAKVTLVAGNMQITNIENNIFDKSLRYCFELSTAVSVAAQNSQTFVNMNNNAYFNCGIADISPTVTNQGYADETNHISLTVDPLVDGANGDFRSNNVNIWNKAIEPFTMTTSSFSKTTTMYDDIGGIQHQGSGVFTIHAQ